VAVEYVLIWPFSVPLASFRASDLHTGCMLNQVEICHIFDILGTDKLLYSTVLYEVTCSD